MKTGNYEQLVAAAMRRELTPAEHQALLSLIRKEPELQERWSIDLQLSQVLRNLPEPPVSTNFTSLVLQAVQKQPQCAPHAPESILVRFRKLAFTWRVSFATLVVLGGVLVHWQYRVRTASEIARNLASMPAEVWSQASLWTDFDSIRTLELANASLPRDAQAPTDDDLLQALR